MKKPPTKKDIRRDLESQVDAFLRDGGEIETVDRGRSGLDASTPWRNPFQSSSNGEPKTERTPVPEVVAAIDSRKQKKPPQTTRRHRRPRKEWIYDDFGEPVRWVWKE
ncbi:hypothetical protein [Saccharospirillum mangrovi]|uniref:hypothetical protein n=1 Tax=Saccharospirillum mangrovi TaxID=2161747 RepID=UPI000D38B41D|nr:hypothetical protein [Saccharospirillum mangrovi]